MRHNISTLAHAFVNDGSPVTASANNNFHLTHPDLSRLREVWTQLKSYETVIAERFPDNTFGVNQHTYGSSFTGRHRNAVYESLEEAGYVKTGKTYERSVWFMNSRRLATFDIFRKEGGNA